MDGGKPLALFGYIEAGGFFVVVGVALFHIPGLNELFDGLGDGAFAFMPKFGKLGGGDTGVVVNIGEGVDLHHVAVFRLVGVLGVDIVMVQNDKVIKQIGPFCNFLISVVNIDV